MTIRLIKLWKKLFSRERSFAGHDNQMQRELLDAFCSLSPIHFNFFAPFCSLFRRRIIIVVRDLKITDWNISIGDWTQQIDCAQIYRCPRRLHLPPPTMLDRCILIDFYEIK